MISRTGISGTGISGTGISGTEIFKAGISRTGISGTEIFGAGISGTGISVTGISGTGISGTEISGSGIFRMATLTEAALLGFSRNFSIHICYCYVTHWPEGPFFFARERDGHGFLIHFG